LNRSLKQLNADITACTQCDRLVTHCRKVAVDKRAAYRDDVYWGKPVPNFGDAPAKILIVGLAPGAHGANRTGRMFTGDRSGDWLYRALHKAGLANQPISVDRFDGTELIECAITAVCCCAPPGNKPTTEEVKTCSSFFNRTIEVYQPQVFLALGGLAWSAVLKHAIGRQWVVHPSPRPKFGHQQIVEMTAGRSMVGSYHPSQQNTFTGRLTEKMLDDVFKTAKKLAK
jgi:uracil-DNA glycosylase family 4